MLDAGFPLPAPSHAGSNTIAGFIRKLPMSGFLLNPTYEIDDRIPVEPAGGPPPSTPSQQELSDEQIEEAVWDELRRNGRVELEERRSRPESR